MKPSYLLMIIVIIPSVIWGFDILGDFYIRGLPWTSLYIDRLFYGLVTAGGTVWFLHIEKTQ